MRLVKCERKVVEEARSYRTCKMQKMVQEFVDSDMDCAEIKDFHQKNAAICANTFNKACQRMNIKGVKAITRKNRCYLIREKISIGDVEDEPS